MSMNIIVIAVICIAILVVLLVIFTGKTKLFSKSLASCESKGAGAHCIGASATDICDGSRYKFGTDCAERNAQTPDCCVPVGGV